MSITLMTRYQIENKKTKYKYALYGGLQNKNKLLTIFKNYYNKYNNK